MSNGFTLNPRQTTSTRQFERSSKNINGFLKKCQVFAEFLYYRHGAPWAARKHLQYVRYKRDGGCTNEL